MEWVPSWLAKIYAIMYAEKGTAWFSFDEAKTILGIKENDILSFRLTKLEKSGFLVVKRDAVDRRKKYFRVLNPNDVFFSYGIESQSQTKDGMQRLVLATKRIAFVIGRAYAAYIHSGYAVPGKIDIYVKKEDLDKCISLLSDKFTSVSIDDMLAEKIRRTNFHLHSSLTEEMIEDSVIIEGIRYESPESLIINGLKEQSDFYLTDSFSVLIKKRKDIDFNKILKIAKAEMLERELGASLELLNHEAKKRVFSDEIIRKIRLKADLSRKKIFPKQKTESNDYPLIGEKWNLQITLPRAFVSKIITDLVR
ncbi:MAG: hypothetical protein ACK4TO_00320 [Candidatus Nitrosotenuis sp.]